MSCRKAWVQAGLRDAEHRPGNPPLPSKWGAQVPQLLGLGSSPPRALDSLPSYVKGIMMFAIQGTSCSQESHSPWGSASRWALSPGPPSPGLGGTSRVDRARLEGQPHLPSSPKVAVPAFLKHLPCTCITCVHLYYLPCLCMTLFNSQGRA